MARICCPHCQKTFRTSHSAFVTGRESGVGTFPKENYHPDPKKKYKTPEKIRRTALAYYWKQRVAVLAREKRRRRTQSPIHVSIHD